MEGTGSRKILITGVSRGLGRAMAERCIREGHIIIGCCRSQKTADELQGLHGDRHLFSAVNVADDGEVAAWAEEAVEQFDAPDLLLNNAALINRNAALWEITAREFDEVIDVNIKGVANVVRHFVPAMIDRGAGVIVNFSSGWGRSTSPEVAPYCATKFAIEGLTEALSQELPSGVAAISLNPGVINTDMLQSCFGGASSAYPTAEQWAERAVPFLLALGSSDNGRSLDVA